MKAIVLTLMLASVVIAAAPAPPTSAPATLPASRTSEMEPLADGTVRFTPPPGWLLVNKRPDDLGATYKTADENAVVLIEIQPLNRVVKESSKDQMARIIDKGIRDAAAKEKLELLQAPKQIDDPRFFLKMHDALRIEGKVQDRMQWYRVIGLNLVHAAATSRVDAINPADPALAAAEEMMATMRVSRGSKRVLYPHAQLRAVVPLDWTEKRIDQANGAVATYSDPKDPSREIVLNARIVPKATLEDKAKLDAFVAKMADQERVLPSRLAAQLQGEENIPGSKYVRETRMKLSGDTNGPMRWETRYIVVGDVLASVRSIARDADADAMDAIADRFAGSLKPVKD
jgi:hypothetical protein